MYQALLYQKLKDKKVRCEACSHRCLIFPNRRGICGVRENRQGKLYSLVYGKAAALNIDPIEKKPFYHFMPGTFSLSIASVGCNFRCKNCQNWDISQGPKKDGIILGEPLTPEKVVKRALKYKCPSISYTYTEPTVFIEYALEIMKIAKKKGLKNTWVSNGFMTLKTLEMISPYLDAANIDLKSFSQKFYGEVCGARLEPVLESLKWMKKHKIWLEVTTLVIPALSDSEKMFSQIAKFIYKELGPQTPWHISRFSGLISFELQHLPDTPKEKIYQAYEIGKKAGLKYVYSGNLAGDKRENTYCPKCGEIAIKRFGYEIERRDKDGFCSKCGERLDLVLP